MTARSTSPVVLVTGLGAIIGQGIAKSLRVANPDVRVVGLDRNPHSSARYFCDQFFAKPSCDESSPQYLSFWNELLSSEGVDLVMPGLEQDVLFLSRCRAALHGDALFVLNAQRLIDLARDKGLLGVELAQLGLPMIPTTTAGSWDECLEQVGPPPLLLKPRFGTGSRGIVRLEDANDFRYWTAKSKQPVLIQRIIGSDDEEYTAGAFGLGDGTSLRAIIFRRALSPAGNTSYAEVVDLPTIQDAIDVLSAHFKPIGPTNYQFRIEAAVPYLLEINPRFSSSGSLRTAFGYNEAEMAVEFYLSGRKPQTPDIRPGRAWRYYEDVVAK